MNKISVYVFVDALGWDLVQKHGFLNRELPFRQKAKMQFGYSSTAIPTILSGQSPAAHGHFSFYFYDPANSPFKAFKYIKYLFGAGLHPNCITNRGRVRRWLSKFVKKLKGYTGYFQLYAMPYNRLPLFNYCEKTDIFAQNGLLPVKNLRDVLIERGVKYHMSDWRKSEEKNLSAVLKAIGSGEIDFAFVYTANLDGFLHNKVSDEKAVAGELAAYEKKMLRIYDALKATGRPFKFTVISDHGMTPLKSVCDLKKTVAETGLKFNKDYVCVFDSTMARFWYFTPAAKDIIRKKLTDGTCPGRFIEETEKETYGINFPNAKFGEDIFLMNSGVQISPSDMGNRGLPGMHGYSPEEKESDASLLSSEEIALPVREVRDFFQLMIADAKKREK